MNEIAVLLVDDHHIFRDGLQSLLNGVKDIRVMDVAGNGVEAIKKYNEIVPDVVVLDISLPGMNGFEIAQKIKEQNPDTKILILSMHESPEYIQKALKLNINGYLSKEETSQKLLIEAIKEIYKGNTFFSPKIKYVVDSEVVTTNIASSLGIISKREKEILTLIIQGLSNAEIAKKLFLSQRTVETHKFNIMNKLNVKNSVELVKWVLQNKLLE